MAIDAEVRKLGLKLNAVHPDKPTPAKLEAAFVRACKRAGLKPIATLVRLREEEPVNHIASQFPEHPGFATAIRTLLAAGEAEDSSWHNDRCPSVERDVHGWAVRIWDDGDNTDGPRFQVSQYKPDSFEEDRDSVYTRSATKAVETFRRWVRALLIESPSPSTLPEEK
jgi:hypothetical protein